MEQSEINEILRAMLYKLREMARVARGHDPYTPDLPEREDEDVPLPDWLARRLR